MLDESSAPPTPTGTKPDLTDDAGPQDAPAEASPDAPAEGAPGSLQQRLVLTTQELADAARRKSAKLVEVAHEKYPETAAKVDLAVEVARHKLEDGTQYVQQQAETLRDASKQAWEVGKVRLQRARESLQGGWAGNATATLAGTAASEEWNEIKVKGAEEINVPRRSTHTFPVLVNPGHTLSWIFRCKDHDIGFAIRTRIMQDGGSVEQDVMPVERCSCEDTVDGHWTNESSSTKQMILAFDNTYSLMRGKTVAFMVGTGLAPPQSPKVAAAKVEEPTAAEPTAADPEQAAAVPVVAAAAGVAAAEVPAEAESSQQSADAESRTI